MPYNLFLFLILAPFFVLEQDAENLIFEKLENDVHWKLEMTDDGTGNWKWSLLILIPDFLKPKKHIK